MSIESPFGKSITSEDIVDTLSFFDDWEERYKYIIDLGKELPGMSDDKKTDDFLLRGCQSQVWIDHATFESSSEPEYIFSSPPIEAYSHSVSVGSR